MKFLEKLQKLGNTEKQIILWSVVIILAVAFFFLWLKVTKIRLENLDKDQIIKGITIPDIHIPTFTVPTLPEQLPTDITF